MRRYRVCGPLLLLAVMIILLLPVGAVAAATTFTDPQGRFSFTVPDGYTSADVSAHAVAAYRSPTYTGANVTVGAEKAGAVTLDQLPGQVLKVITGTLKDAQPGPLGIQSTTVAGYPAVSYDYIATIASIHIRGQQFAFIAGGNVYIITFTARDTDFTAFMREAAIILTSFSVSGGATASATAPSSTTPSVVPSPVAAPAAPTTTTLRPGFIRRLGDG